MKQTSCGCLPDMEKKGIHGMMIFMSIHAAFIQMRSRTAELINQLLPFPGGLRRELFLLTALLPGMGCGAGSPSEPDITTTPAHDKRYGIYSLDLSSGAVDLIYSSDNPIGRIHENPSGTILVFEKQFGEDIFTHSEICLINTDGSGYRRITDNLILDSYPTWSPDGAQILFLSWPDYPSNTMDIFVMDATGANPVELYDSGFHDGDIHWVDSKIVFTRESQIWVMDDDGTNAVQLTDYELAGQQGSADLPFGDYDPRIDPSCSMVCFDRMIDDQSPSGNYNFYTVNLDGTGETAITDTGWQQFMAEWSPSGGRLLFMVAAMGGGGIYDMYTMNPDGSDRTNITPPDWPPEFLCTHGVYSAYDSIIYFAGEWWQQ